MIGRSEIPSLRKSTSIIHTLIPFFSRKYTTTASPAAAQPGPPSASFYGYQSLAISGSEDNANIRQTYRLFILKKDSAEDWVNNLELIMAMDMAARELRGLNNKSFLSAGPDSSGNRVISIFGYCLNSTGIWLIPLSTGSMHPTQGRMLAIPQVYGGSQSFNTINSLRILGRWMRIFTIPNQSSIPKVYIYFPDEGQPGDQRLLSSSNRDRVDCMEEFMKYTLMRPRLELFGNRFSEREEKQAKDKMTRAKKV
ncbi:LOW QUALITY PROTEIN: uncharacterized protein An04g07690 [Aspergillus niger]|uniref:Contig An04c0240, genomic contig n=2 Tax=Aspergillus niger TaxID=5061 RepID=A2QJN5_ASPNC|nr:LOW QUALITY PROTEIN: uncharacterized protein An04g07690 [Aspergillus niger]CAK44750.1 unnamed protein product [Aspergillus niger]